ncbi:MAG: histidinol-phosphate transaminase, partial [Limnobacter sp.]|nr:histidinol-phosphate transaminase [Limnobacter sp.]
MANVKKIVRADVQATQVYSVAPAKGMLKLDAMENPNQLPLDIRQELAERIVQAELNRYPVPDIPELEEALRKSTAIPRGAQVMFGNGSDELIDIIIRTCCEPGDVVLSPVPTFVMYEGFAKWAHARFVGVDLRDDFTLNMPATLRAISANQPKVVFLAYPNNPTGLALKESEILQIIDVADGLVVVDEAYEPFASHSFMQRVLEFPNVVVVRTLSKMGLAGIRLGYMAGSKAWIEQFNKVRPPYNVNVLTRIASQCALEHFHVLKEQAEKLKTNRSALVVALRKLGKQTGVPLEVIDSQANFLLFRVPNATHVFEALKT